MVKIRKLVGAGARHSFSHGYIAYMARKLTELGLEVVEHRYVVPSRTAVNLEVIIPGRKPQPPVLIVGAHYDAASKWG